MKTKNPFEDDTSPNEDPAWEEHYLPTPGPYAYRREESGVDEYWHIVARDDPSQTLASILFWGDDPEWRGRTEANARLFAAAPELLESLKQLLAAATSGGLLAYRRAVTKAWAAVAEAEGRARPNDGERKV